VSIVHRTKLSRCSHAGLVNLCFASCLTCFFLLFTMENLLSSIFCPNKRINTPAVRSMTRRDRNGWLCTTTMMMASCC
jgi:hypothetical protein